MKARCTWAIAAAASLSGCDDESLRIRLDVNKNCNEVQVETVLPRADAAGPELLDAAMDPDTDAVWLLVSHGALEPTVEVQRVVDGEVERRLEIARPAEPGELVLRVSPDPDEVWMMHRGPGAFRLWRIHASATEVPLQASRDLGDFPHDSFTCSPCDTDDWYRDLVFLGGRAYVVSVPPLSPTASVSLWVGTLVASPPGSGLIDVGTEHRLNFEKMCPPTDDPFVDEACEASKAFVTYPRIEVLGRQLDPRFATARFLVHRGRTEDQGLAASRFDVFVVTLGVELDGVPKGVLRSYEDPWIAGVDPPHGLAVDPFASYALFSSELAGPRFLRLPSPPGELEFEDLSAQVDPLTSETQVLQLNADIALGRIVDGEWEITKLFPDSLSRSLTTVHRADAPITQVHGIGGGTFLLWKADDSADVVRVRCVEPPL